MQRFLDDEGSSFVDYLARQRPDLAPAGRPWSPTPSSPPLIDEGGAPPLAAVTRGTTVLAIRYQRGVVIAGDRRATEGSQIAGRRIEKVSKIDEHSAMAIAGAAGPCLEMAKLFQTELEHYEKLEGIQ
ncbi:MAG: proteasome subunit beta, partial [Nitrospiraceae bacterium]